MLALACLLEKILGIQGEFLEKMMMMMMMMMILKHSAEGFPWFQAVTRGDMVAATQVAWRGESSTLD